MPSFMDYVCGGWIYVAWSENVVCFCSYFRPNHYVKGCDGLRIEYFLPYTPELNAIETQWRVMEDAAGNRVYGDVVEMEDSIRTMIRQKVIVPVKLSDFLRC